MNYGLSYSLYRQRESTSIVLVEGVHEYRIGIVQMRFFYVPRTGSQWGALEQTEFVPHSCAHDRFQEWVKADVFSKLWKTGLEKFDELKGIDWEWQSMDGAMTKAPLGGEKNRC